MNPEASILPRVDDDESTVSAATSELDLRLSSDGSDDEHQNVSQKNNEKPGKQPQAQESWKESVLDGREPFVESVIGCIRLRGELMHLVRERFRREPIVVPASYVNSYFPQASINFYESLIQWELEKKNV